MTAQFEADCMYCPQCGDEYRPEIRRCASCGVALVAGREMLRAAATAPVYREIEPHEKLRTVQRGPILQMRQLQDCLRTAGLASLLAPCKDGCRSGCRGAEAELQVRVSELELVETALEREYRQSTALSGHDAETGLSGALFAMEVKQAACPACGCLFSTDAPLCPDCGLRFV